MQSLVQLLHHKEEATAAVLARAMSRTPDLASRSRRDRVAGMAPKGRDAALSVEGVNPGAMPSTMAHQRYSVESSSEEDYYTASVADSNEYIVASGAEELGEPVQEVNVVTGHPTRFERRTQGGAAHGATQPIPPDSRRRPSGQVIQQSRIIPIVCFICYKTGHIAPECPHKSYANDPRWQQHFRDNFARLSEVLQAWLKEQKRLPGQSAHQQPPAPLAPASERQPRPRPPGPPSTPDA